MYLAGREWDETKGERMAPKGCGGGGRNRRVKKYREKVQGWGAGGVGGTRSMVTASPATSYPENQGVVSVVRPLIASQKFK